MDKFKILWERIALKATYVISHVYLTGTLTDGTKYDHYRICDGLEDCSRGLKDTMNEEEILKKKVKGKTAIPTGTYPVDMNTVSPKYSTSSFYKTNANGSRVPRLKNVKGFDGILIHTGNDENDTEGCLLVGENTVVGKVMNSKVTFQKLYPILQKAVGEIEITISE